MASLIGPRHVLTASHVIDWTPGWARAVSLLQQNSSFIDSANATVVYASTQIGPGPIGDSDSDEDYAVLVLDKRLGDTYGWYGARTYDSAWDDEVSAWRNIGYPNDKGWFSVVPVYQRDFFLRQTNTDFGSARLIRCQTFDNWPGQSGGPVLFPASGTMAPTSSASYRAKGRDYNYISGGSLLPSLVSQARTEMP